MIKSKSKKDEIIRLIKRGIMMGTYKQGQTLASVASLAEIFGVAQSVIREAIGVLKADGFLAVKPGRKGGIIVEDRGLEILTDRLMERLLMGEIPFEQTAQLRLLLEIEACRSGTPNADERTVARLEELNEGMNNAEDPEFERLNIAFHETIWSLSGNVLQGIIIKLLLQFASRAAQVFSTDFRRMHSLDEHRPIIQAVADRDPQRASHFLRKHIEDSNQRIREMETDFFSRAIRESFSGYERATIILDRGETPLGLQSISRDSR
jgi:DNA-binding FadR family transcriptional regulator